MLYVVLSCGVVLLAVVPYIAVKLKAAGQPVFTNKGLGAIAVIAVAFITVAIVGITLTKDDEVEEEAEKPQALNWSLVNTKSESIDVGILKNAIIIFQNNCEGLQKYYNAVEKLEAQVVTYRKGENPSYTEDKYGWLTELTLTISIRKDAKLPAGLQRLPGVTLYYYLGAGHSPGVVMMKDESALFYGIPETQITRGQNTFIRDDAYAIVDSIPISK